jgi:hypothetical protein
MDKVLNEIDQELEAESNELESKLNKYLIDVNEEIPPPEKAWEVRVETSYDFTVIGTLGNFSLIKGKAKSKKSFLVSMAISSAIGEGVLQNTLRSPLKVKNQNVLYFDTEQSKYHVQNAVKRISVQIGKAIPNNLKTYTLRKESPSERFKMVEYAIENTPRLGFVVIDGIRDLITSINDESESTMMASKLLEWTEKYNMHIVTILHENPTGEKARGHLGTELTNKAETVITVEVDKDNKEVSIVKPTSCRNKPFEPFAFRIDENGIPEIIDDYEINMSNSSKKINILSIEDEQKFEVIETLFNNKSEYDYAELVEGLKSLIKSSYRQYSGSGTNSVKSFIKESKEKGWLIQEQPKAKYTLGLLKV